MKAIVIHQYGGPEVLKFEDVPDPVAGAGEVVLRVAAASINPIDIAERAGLTKDFKPVTFPGVLGWDLAGTVISVGPDVKGFSLGDKALAWAYHTYAELCAVKAELLAKVPEGLDLVEAAALPLVTITGNELISRQRSEGGADGACLRRVGQRRPLGGLYRQGAQRHSDRRRPQDPA